MNKKLLALAVAGALAAPLAAQADVAVYGQAHVSYDGVQTGANGVQTGVVANSSRLGVKGGEDLGDGLKGIFQIESGVAMTNGSNTATLGSRDSFVGVQGAWGSLRAGRFDTPYKRATGGFDAFGDTVADMNNIMGAKTGSASFGNGFNQRLNNSLGYDGSFGGVSIAAQMGTSEAGATSGQAKTSVSGFSVGYNLLGANIGAAYEKQNNIGASLMSAKADKIYGDYTLQNLGNTRVSAAYETIKADDGTKRKDYWLQGSVPFAGNNAVSAAYTKAKLDGASAGAKMEAVGVEHSFSKRTKVYGIYSRIANDAAGSFGFGADHGDNAALYTVPSGQTTKAASVGIVTKF